jgi:hypothetical protein
VDFTPSGRPKKVEPIDFSLAGEPYLFTPPQNAAMAVAIVKAPDELRRMRAMFVWLGQGLNPDHEPYGDYAGHTSFVQDCQGCRLESQINDPSPENLITIELISEIVSWLLAEVSERRPPTSSGGSSATRSAVGRRSTVGARAAT